MRWIVITMTVLSMAACKDMAVSGWLGYVEGEYVRVASPEAGTLQALKVERGQIIVKGAPLFALESDSEASARHEAEQRVRQADARLANLEQGKRPDEIAAIQAQQARARAALGLSRTNLARQEELVAAGFISHAVLDAARVLLSAQHAALRLHVPVPGHARHGPRPSARCCR